jgi:drug/metabolite transporter (DMT)-like permease
VATWNPVAVTGELFGLLAAGAFALATVLSRRFMVGPKPVAPEAGVFVSIVTNVAVFSLLAAVEVARISPRLTGRSLLYFVLGGLCGTVAGRNLSYQSVLRIGPSRSTAIRLSNTLFAALMGLAVLRELPRPGQLAGAALITVGLWLVLRERAPGPQGRPDPVGVLLALGGAVGFALGDTFRRAGLQITPAPFLGAAVGACTALLVQTGWLAVRDRPVGSDRPWRVDVLASALANTAAILLLFLGLQRSPVANVAVLYNLQVLLVILLSRWMLRGDEQVGPGLVVGSVVCVAGTAAVLFG